MDDISRYFDTGDRAVDGILTQLGHMSRRCEVLTTKQFEDWLIGFIQRWKSLPNMYQSLIENNCNIGGTYSNLGVEGLSVKLNEIQESLDRDIEGIIENMEVAGRSNAYNTTTKAWVYGDRSNALYGAISRDYETKGEVVKRICAELQCLEGSSYNSPKGIETVGRLAIASRGHRNIQFEVEQLQKLINKKWHANYCKAKSDAVSLVFKIEELASNWHLK